MAGDVLEELRHVIRAFADARDWQQFHTPKNLVMALSVEVAELMEHFQWLTAEQSQELDVRRHEQVEQEMGDVLIYLIRLADVLNIDLAHAASAKMRLNEAKYPVDKARGIAAKYTELGE
jgi:NTP pyrophosphatase (non-canonical NTP hydrolase)